MQAASREALRRLQDRLLGPDRGDDELSRIGDDLFGVVGLLGRELSLRRAVGDPSTDPQRRRALVERLLASRIGRPALELVDEAAAARWSRPSELVEGLERLARIALLVTAERADRLDAVEDELFRFGRIVAGQSDLERVLSDPQGVAEGKRAVLDRLLGGKVDPLTQRLVDELVANPRGRKVGVGLTELAELAAARREQSIARVRSAVALSEDQQARLATTLGNIYRRRIALHVEVDPSLGGGIVIQMGDEVIDGSAAGALNNLRRRLAG